MLQRCAGPRCVCCFASDRKNETVSHAISSTCRFMWAFMNNLDLSPGKQKQHAGCSMRHHAVEENMQLLTSSDIICEAVVYVYHFIPIVSACFSSTRSKTQFAHRRPCVGNQCFLGEQCGEQMRIACSLQLLYPMTKFHVHLQRTGATLLKTTSETTSFHRFSSN